MEQPNSYVNPVNQVKHVVCKQLPYVYIHLEETKAKDLCPWKGTDLSCMDVAAAFIHELEQKHGVKKRSFRRK